MNPSLALKSLADIALEASSDPLAALDAIATIGDALASPCAAEIVVKARAAASAIRTADRMQMDFRAILRVDDADEAILVVPTPPGGGITRDSWDSPEDYEVSLDEWQPTEIRQGLRFEGYQAGEGVTLALFTEMRKMAESFGATFAVPAPGLTAAVLTEARRNKAREFASASKPGARVNPPISPMNPTITTEVRAISASPAKTEVTASSKPATPPIP